MNKKPAKADLRPSRSQPALLDPHRRPFAVRKPKREIDLDDEARFLKSWLENPLKTGAVAPSGKALAQKMAASFDPTIPVPSSSSAPAPGRSRRRFSRAASRRSGSISSNTAPIS